MDTLTEGVELGHHKIVFDLWLSERITIDNDFIGGKGQAYLFDEGHIFDMVAWEFVFVEEIVLDFGDAAFNVRAFAFETE